MIVPDTMSNDPYWWSAAPPDRDSGCALPARSDVLIVGAGYTGLSAAIVLARAGRHVVVVDKAAPGEGASTRNGGITSGNLRLSHGEIAKRFGLDRADGVMREAKLAREDLYRFIDEENIACDFKLVGRFAGALSRSQYDTISRETEYLRTALGIESFPVTRGEQDKYVGTDFYQGGSVRMDVGGLHPGKLHSELLRIARTSGVSVIGMTAVSSISTEGSDHVVRTTNGIVRAHSVISATNGYTDASDKWLRRRIVPIRSRIIVTEPIPRALMDRLLPKRMMISDKRKLTYYYRPTPDGTRILFGGRDGTLAGEPDWPTSHLKTEMINIFPELAGTALTHSWFGYVAMNRDMMPRIFQNDGVHYATGCCGSGVVWLRWAGIKVASKILGNDVPSALDFGPPKSIPLFRGKAWFMPPLFAIMKAQDKLGVR